MTETEKQTGYEDLTIEVAADLAARLFVEATRQRTTVSELLASITKFVATPDHIRFALLPESRPSTRESGAIEQKPGLRSLKRRGGL